MRLLFCSVLLLSLLATGDSVKDRGDPSEQDVGTDRMLTAWIIPHSHCDVGWKETIDQYYSQNVSRILDSVVQALQLNPTRYV